MFFTSFCKRLAWGRGRQEPHLNSKSLLLLCGLSTSRAQEMQELEMENHMLQMEHQTILRIHSLLPPLARGVSKTKWLPGTLVHSHFPGGFLLSSWYGEALSLDLDKQDSCPHTSGNPVLWSVFLNFSKFSLKGVWDPPRFVSPLSILWPSIQRGSPSPFTYRIIQSPQCWPWVLE